MIVGNNGCQNPEPEKDEPTEPPDRGDIDGRD
jgi:hypothetical protein